VVRHIFRILDVPQEDDIAQAVHLAIRRATRRWLLDVALRKGKRPRPTAIFSRTVAIWGQVPSILRIDAARCGLRAGGKAQEQIPMPLQSDHHFHARQQLPGFCSGTRVIVAVTPGVYFQVNSIQFFSHCRMAFRRGTWIPVAIPSAAMAAPRGKFARFHGFAALKPSVAQAKVFSRWLCS